MTKAGTIWLMFLALVLLTTGCRSLLPTDDTRTLNQWQNFDEAQASIRMEDLHPDVRACIESKDACRAYELTLDVSHSKRHGNVVLDVLAFKKNTTTTGWNFKALVIVKDDMVAYKIRSGAPLVTRNVQSIKPLGPFQELDSFVKSMAKP